MPSPSEETRRKCALIKGRFTGDPSHEYEHSEKTLEEEGQDEEGNIVCFCNTIFVIFSLNYSN